MKKVKYQITKKKYLIVEVENEEDEECIKLLNRLFYRDRDKDFFYRKNVVSLEKIKEKGFDFVDDTLQAKIILEKENEFLSVAIKSLPSRQQQIIRYIFYQGHTLYEASKMLKIHYQSAYDLKRRALKRLKKIITKQFYD